MVHFVEVLASHLDQYLLDGSPLSKHDLGSIESRANASGIPKETQHDEHVLRILLAALLAAGGSERLDTPSGPGQAVSSALPRWKDLHEQARAFLVAGIKREGCVSAKTADAVNLLNRPHVMEPFQKFGNRWTIADAEIDHGMRRPTRADETNVEELVRPVAQNQDKTTRPWYCSKPVLAVLSIAVIFVLVHIALLLRVLSKVHKADPNVLLLPVVGLSASACIALLAVGINKLSG
mmetsp:Transcript_56474/g.93329  ORF Transcript_56474/g.93329 Transcript_56474/m.93329 type:complete len:236 (-) Transcript_56474:260-967(-)|eukprot:CAMPEP_0119319684 /NCGR_PEP_ID=MMETSP1333-20130426/50057_1 /TAXON_ID=418940 /ORGANISM="Scyphosphaera apsteinii, Strain RCC1455" /LENGTH=235 /DNA_ID=CAMNT_0007326155 /DNA_START=30 /DNA_END=737 /DNA_ORIENTATION=-